VRAAPAPELCLWPAGLTLCRWSQPCPSGYKRERPPPPPALSPRLGNLGTKQDWTQLSVDEGLASFMEYKCLEVRGVGGLAGPAVPAA
jgi:hypothetical protein